MTFVSEFTSSQGLALNVDKCDISPSFPVDSTHILTGDLQFPLTTSARCLGVFVFVCVFVFVFVFVFALKRNEMT